MKRYLDQNLSQKVREFGRGVLSLVDEDGFPLSLPVTVAALKDIKLELNAEPSFLRWLNNEGKSCLLFHSYNDGLENLKQLLVKGYATLERERILFHPESMFEFQRKGGFLATLRFIISGKKNARRYLERSRHQRSPV